MSLRDEHLQQALQHAPDRELAPDGATRKAVLAYAASALHQPSATWLQRCWLALTSDDWTISRWQLAGMGSAITVLLVVVVFWDERTIELRTGEFKDESISVASAPTDNFQRKADALAEGKLAEPASERAADEKSQAAVQATPSADAASRVIVASSEPPAVSAGEDKSVVNPKVGGREAEKSETLPSKSAAINPAEKFIVANAPEAVIDQDIGKSNDASVGLKQRSLPGSAAPASAPAQEATAVTGIAERSDGMGKAEVDKANLAKKLASNKEARSEAKAKADAPGVVGATVSARNNALALAITKEGGKTIATKDIQLNKLRMLYLGKPFSADKLLVDEATGYPIQILAGCDVTEALIAEVEAYNQAMRDWSLKNGPNLKPALTKP